jgi:hypothetical protein
VLAVFIAVDLVASLSVLVSLLFYPRQHAEGYSFSLIKDILIASIRRPVYSFFSVFLMSVVSYGVSSL